MSKYENRIMEVLKKEKISFVKEKTFKDLKKGLYRFDFYLPNVNGLQIIVEVDGEQHFSPVYGRQAFMKGQEHDRQKNSYCLAHGIILYRIPYWEIANIKKFRDITQLKFLVKDRWHNDCLRPPH